MKKFFLLSLCCVAALFVNAQKTTKGALPEISTAYNTLNRADGYFHNGDKWEKNLNMINCLQNQFGHYEARSILCAGNSYYVLLKYNAGNSTNQFADQYLTNETVIDYVVLDTKVYMNTVATIKTDAMKMNTVKFPILKSGTATNLEDLTKQCQSICEKPLANDNRKLSYLVLQARFDKEKDEGTFLIFTAKEGKNGQLINPFPANCNIGNVFMTNFMFDKAYFLTSYNQLYNFIFFQ